MAVAGIEMGSCVSKTSKVTITLIPGPAGCLYTDLAYERTASLRALKQSAEGRGSQYVQIHFPLTDPYFISSKKVAVAGKEFWVSACVLPGTDPHMTTTKQCQDMCFFDTDGETLICGVFDGHGPNGRDVAQFCAKAATAFYNNSKQMCKEDSLAFLEAITKKLDTDMHLSTNGIDVSGSGSTEVLLLLNQSTVYIAGVGDSRGILGSLSPPEEPPAIPRVLRGEGKEFMDMIHSKRGIPIDIPIQSVQLTKDQKPEDTEELIRIFKCGGRVMRLPDENGKPVGPYRVFKPNTNGPGLAMSRSIGDTLGTDLGVIPDPVLTQHEVKWDGDLFMVCASDGIWDVIGNEEVVAFLERYRHSAVRGVSAPALNAPVSCSNATIAQLLCEEARVRWFSIIEKEEVLIDDISCVVVEFSVNS